MGLIINKIENKHEREFRRTLTLLEHLSTAKAESVTVVQRVERTGLASSTVYRPVQELEVLGYLRKAADRRLFPELHFEQRMNIGGWILVA